jgi:predicted small lipoprotein YifL
MTRRVLLLGIMLVPVAACGKKGALELPPAGEEDEEK